MNNKIIFTYLSMLVFISFTLNAQVESISSVIGEDQYYSENNEVNPCITVKQYELLETRCNNNLQILNADENFQRKLSSSIILMDWPVKAASALHDCSFYHVAAYVDQDTIVGSVRDFNCGTITYDGHRGTDISIWPYNFYKMDNNLVEVVAAAAGIIIDKHDGEFDRNCTSNNLTANYVIIQHSDGSRALYWHMKNGAVTLKPIGQPVIAGEYLGIVGSSGSSSGPHLHFEVWNGSTVATRVDPFAGSCNSLNVATWWTSQKPHRETGIVKASVHTTDVIAPPCPATETLNESSLFVIPFQGPGLPAGYAKFYIFIRDELNGLTGNLSILNPNGSTYLSWTYTSTSDSKTKMWGWSKVLPTNPGIYTFTATYNGVTCSSDFEIVSATGILTQGEFSKMNIYPNPSSGKIYFEFDDNKTRIIEIYNLLAEKIYQIKLIDQKFEINLNLEDGIYICKIVEGDYIFSIKKLILDSSHQ